MIMIISFVKISEGTTIYQINACLMIIILFLLFMVQIIHPPFITKELNNLEYLSTMIILITVFGGLFTSISQKDSITETSTIIIFLLNLYFIFSFYKNYLLLLLILRLDDKSKNMDFTNKLAKRYLFACTSNHMKAIL